MENATPNPFRRNSKRSGELSGASFLLKAESLGLHVSYPWGDSERYDFILDAGSRLWRVQLKSTEARRGRCYRVQSSYGIYGRSNAAYTAADIDILVAHIVPKDTWYVLPIEAFVPLQSLCFYPDFASRRARWEKYREAWHLLRPARST